MIFVFNVRIKIVVKRQQPVGGRNLTGNGRETLPAAGDYRLRQQKYALEKTDVDKLFFFYFFTIISQV